MKRAPLAVLASFAAVAMLAVVACQDAATAPNVASPEVRMDVGNPPPPPIDSGGVSSTESPSAPPMEFTLNVTYFFNPADNAGWMMFKSVQGTGVVIDQSAEIHYSLPPSPVVPAFWGHGTIQVTQDVGTLTIDLSTVDYAGSTFAGCETIRPPGDTLPPDPCFSLTLRGAIFTDGERTIGDVIVHTSPGPPDSPTEVNPGPPNRG